MIPPNLGQLKKNLVGAIQSSWGAVIGMSMDVPMTAPYELRIAFFLQKWPKFGGIVAEHYLKLC